MTSLRSKTGLRQNIAGILAGFLCLLSCNVTLAQNVNSRVDNTAPVIGLEELAEVVANSSQVFTVQIEEETELADAILYHRRSGEQSYVAAVMSPLGNSGFYTVTLATDPDDLRTIEYYVQARDTSGNRTVSGFAFDPYQRTLAPAQFAKRAPLVTEEDSSVANNPAIQANEPFYKKRWFHITLGVVAVGLIASSSDSGEDRQTVPVRITLE